MSPFQITPLNRAGAENAVFKEPSEYTEIRAAVWAAQHGGQIVISLNRRDEFPLVNVNLISSFLILDCPPHPPSVHVSSLTIIGSGKWNVGF